MQAAPDREPGSGFPHAPRGEQKQEGLNLDQFAGERNAATDGQHGEPHSDRRDQRPAVAAANARHTVRLAIVPPRADCDGQQLRPAHHGAEERPP